MDRLFGARINDMIIDQDGNELNASSSADRDDRWLAGINHGLFLLGNIIGFSTILAVIIAYARKADAPVWLKSHYNMQIRTFWYAVLGLIGCGFMVFTVILSPFGLLGIAVIWIWVLARSIIGLIRVIDGRSIGNPNGYWV